MSPHPVVASLIIVVVAVTSCGGDPLATDLAPTPAIRVTAAVRLPATVEALPDMDVPGFRELLGQLRGTPVVVNVWAAWCDPCRRETPLLARAARRLADSVQFVGIDILDNRDAARAFLAEFDVPYPSVFDVRGDIRTWLGSIGQPVTVFYGADGEMVRKIDGEISEQDLAAGLDAIAG